ncbi:MAG TPA: PIN domain-containing protein [Acidimicrobiales bacterium]|nr:PIN domain-containing protein [Acidimicrobiales bacterium]
MAVVVLDTDAASRLQKGQLTRAVAGTLVGATVAVTFVTVGELLKWAEVRSWGERRRAELDRWLDLVPVLAVDRAACRQWAVLSAAAERRGRPRPVNDAWVAACCLAADVPLVTYNRADFDFVRHHSLRVLPDDPSL